MTRIHRAGLALLLTALVVPAAHAQTSPDEADQRLVAQMAKALTNDAPSQYELARMYEEGVGTPRDLRLAHLWYTKSAKQGYAPAVERLATWDADIEKVERAEKQRAEQEERARQQAEAARQAKERAAQEAKAKQQAEAEARAAARTRQQSEAAAKAASERAMRQEAAKRKQAAHAEPPATTPVAAKAAAEPAPVPAAEKPEAKADAEKAEFSANPCKGPSAKFMSTCR